MFGVDNYAAVRCFVFVEAHSRREAARLWNVSLARLIHQQWHEGLAGVAQAFALL
jgi:hypothetical protein